ncbi:hypothetical protein HNR46_001124 [Haloferula luteola]|uniref:Heme NO-binding domain-containing protein n=1 Tax=Haloferula luteola TaxID=595692 RepID=A0A840VAB6_9BACT|nr:heme NO-binding domain-containing protein [Haloferula luteola]MBB5350890.1 hypothetical protein [Haloferula luteola]
MYGLVNRAIRDLITTRFGDDAWHHIKQRAGIEVEIFILNESYPDEMTYDLVSASVEELGIPRTEMLRMFGEFWALDTASGPYGALITACGTTLESFLIHLPNLHTRASMMFPNLDAPRFEFEPTGKNQGKLHYITPRHGLTDFIIGIVTGVAKFYGSPCEVQPLELKSDGADHDVLEISWPDAA